jgi:hypothetical protein
VRRARGKHEQRRDHHDVVADGGERGRDEATVGVEERGRQRRECVEDHLREEAEQQDGDDVHLRGMFGA